MHCVYPGFRRETPIHCRHRKLPEGLPCSLVETTSVTLACTEQISCNQIYGVCVLKGISLLGEQLTSQFEQMLEK